MVVSMRLPSLCWTDHILRGSSVLFCACDRLNWLNNICSNHLNNKDILLQIISVQADVLGTIIIVIIIIIIIITIFIIPYTYLKADDSWNVV
jgi:hypothetical protein